MKFVTKNEASLKTESQIDGYFKDRVNVDLKSSTVSVNLDLKSSFLKKATTYRLDSFFEKHSIYLLPHERDLLIEHLSQDLDLSEENTILSNINEKIPLSLNQFDENYPDWFLIHQKMDSLPNFKKPSDHLKLSNELDLLLEKQYQQFSNLGIELSSQSLTQEEYDELIKKEALLANLISNNEKLSKTHFLLGHGLDSAIYSDINECKDLMLGKRNLINQKKNIELALINPSLSEKNKLLLSNQLKQISSKINDFKEAIEEFEDQYMTSPMGLKIHSERIAPIIAEKVSKMKSNLSNLERNRTEVANIYNQIIEIDNLMSSPKIKLNQIKSLHQQKMKLEGQKKAYLLNIASATEPHSRLSELSKKQKLNYYERNELEVLTDILSNKSAVRDLDSKSFMNCYKKELINNPHKAIEEYTERLSQSKKMFELIDENIQKQSQKLLKANGLRNARTKLSPKDAQRLNFVNNQSKKAGTFSSIITYPFRSKERLLEQIHFKKMAIKMEKNPNKRKYLQKQLKYQNGLLKHKNLPLTKRLKKTASYKALSFPFTVFNYLSRKARW